MSVLFLVFMDQILALIGASAETWDYAKTYLIIVNCSGPFVLIANCYSNIIRAEGQSGKAMMGQVIGNLLNVILDPIMILVFGWNIAKTYLTIVSCSGPFVLIANCYSNVIHPCRGAVRQGDDGSALGKSPECHS